MPVTGSTACCTTMNNSQNTPRTALITGASSGIGLATAEKFAGEGWNLVLVARRMEKLLEVKASYPVRVDFLNIDVRDRNAGNNIADYIKTNGLRIDLLVNNAGLASGLEPVHQALVDDWEVMIDTNLKGLLYVSRAITPLMVEQGAGHIINLGSIAGKEAYPNGNVYNATKFAVDGLTKAMRMDLYTFGIRVTQIAPGAVETAFSEVRFHGDINRAKNVYKGFKPLDAKDVADAIWYCANVPPHVSIHDLVIMPTAQAAAAMIHKVL